MGQHSARRSGGAMTSVAGRGLFTATAAVALLGGGTSMAFAGEASSSDGAHAEHTEHQQESHESESCEVPVVDSTVESGESALNAVTGDATAPVFEAGGKVTQPVHDAACPSASELLGPILGGSQTASADDEDAASSEEQSSDEQSSDEQSSEEQPSDEQPSEGSEQAGSSDSDEPSESAEQGSPAPAQPSQPAQPASGSSGAQTPVNIPIQ